MLVEASAGDATAAAERLEILQHLPLLDLNESATEVADALVASGAVPAVASRHAVHVGICATNGIDYLLTRNCRHLANARMQDSIREVCDAQGYSAPVICTPDALFWEQP